MRIVSGSTTESIYFVAVSTSDHVTRVTGHTTAGFGVFFSVGNTTGTTQNIALKEINSTQMPGVYSLTLADSTITTLGAGIDSRELCIHISGSMDSVTRTVELYRPKATAGQTLALNTSGKIADVESILSKVTSIETNTTGLVTKASSIDSNVTLILNKVTSIEANTTALVTGVAVASIANNAITANSIASNALTTAKIASAVFTQTADSFLDRDMSAGTDSGSTSFRTPRQAFRVLRNKVSVPAGTVYKEDDATASWTFAVTTDASASPITVVDPA